MMNTKPLRNDDAPKSFYTVRSYLVGIVCLAFTFFVISGFVYGQELELIREGDEAAGKRERKAEIAERGRRGPDELAEIQEELERQVKEIMAKADRGEEISEKEKGVLARFKATQAKRASIRARKRVQDAERFIQRIRVRKRDRFYEPFLLPPRLNVVDRAYYSAAQILFKQEKYSEVIAELKNIVDRSPDEEAVSYTHFNIADVYRRHLKDPEKAVGEYKEVTGDLAPLARDAIVMTYEETGRVEEAVKELDIMFESVEDVAEKVRILNSIARIYERNEQPDSAIAALRRIPEMITYEEALKMQESYRNDGAESLERQILELTREGLLDEAEQLRRRLYDTFLKDRRRKGVAGRTRSRRER